VGRSAKNDAGGQMERHENADEIGRRFWREEDQWQEQRRHKDADDNCHLEVATDEVREATQSHASESPVPGEGRSPNGPARRRIDMDSDTAMRLAAFAHIKQLLELRDALTASDLKPGFQFGGVRIPLINPQRGIFKPTQMKYLLSIKTVFPRPGGRVWYDDQREVHGQIFAVWTLLATRSWGLIPMLRTIVGCGRPLRIECRLFISWELRLGVTRHSCRCSLRGGMPRR